MNLTDRIYKKLYEKRIPLLIVVSLLFGAFLPIILFMFVMLFVPELCNYWLHIIALNSAYLAFLYSVSWFRTRKTRRPKQARA